MFPVKPSRTDLSAQNHLEIFKTLTSALVWFPGDWNSANQKKFSSNFERGVFLSVLEAIILLILVELRVIRKVC